MKTLSTSLPRLLLAGAALSLLAACAEPPQNQRIHTYDNFRANHPIELRSRVESNPVVVSQKTGITEPEQRKLNRFIDDYLAAGGGQLSIVASDDVDGREAAVHRAETVASYAMRRGVLRHELDVRIGDTTGDEPIVLSFQRYSIKPTSCERDAYEATSTNHRNLLHSRIGCSTQANLAAMLSNPADIAEKRPEAPADANRRSMAIQLYRAGEPTDSARSPFANDFRLSAF